VSWKRVEGSCRDPQVTAGLAARVADPLWALARQWQVGEFAGEDAASPVLVSAVVAHTALTAFAPGLQKEAGTPEQALTADRPLEVLVEQELVDDDVRLNVEQGWLLLRQLTAAAIPQAVTALRARYTVGLGADDGADAVGRAQLELMAHRSCDAFRIASELDVGDARAISTFVRGLGVPASQNSQAESIITVWLASVRQFVRVPTAGPCWKNEPLEYQFRVAAPLEEGELSLAASEYRGGSLDWYHFARSGVRDPLGATGTPQVRALTVLPTPLRFHGMPAARFWAIEDDLVSFGDLAAGPEDLVRAVVGAFAAVYGDDWMVIPCVLPIGSLARVEALVVLDDFGEAHRVQATAMLDGPDRAWRWFEIEGDEGPNAAALADRRAPVMLLAPALADVEEGPPLERVDFIRDQAANLAWAIERNAPGASGRPIDRDARSALPETRQSDRDWSYQAYSPARVNWIPFTPVRADGTGTGTTAQVFLRRGRMAMPPPGMTLDDLVPKGRLLDARAPMRIYEEAIPDAGLRVDRRYQRTRGADGRVHVWVGRRVRTGAWPSRGQFTADRLLRLSPPQR
jgi:hypothetical protein